VCVESGADASDYFEALMRRRIDIIALVTMLLLIGALAVAGVQWVRESAKQAKCSNNLKQIGFAILNYMTSTALDQFPTATMSNTGLEPEQRLSCLVELMPYLEAAPRGPYDQKKPWGSFENRPQYFTFRGNDDLFHQGHWGHQRSFICPSRAEEFDPIRFSLTQYVGMAGIGYDAATLPLDASGNGFFGYDRHITKADIRNDLAHTLMAIETGHANGPWVASGFPTVRGVDPDGLPYFGEGGQFGGIHPGGVNALFADGSVRFLSNETSRDQFEAMCRIAP
jgi:prepilin-type processing-associated H-X9-DG protein